MTKEMGNGNLMLESVGRLFIIHSVSERRKLMTSLIAPSNANDLQLRNEDIYWAQHDPQVEQLFGGQWVVPFQGRILAHGEVAAEVLAEAARLIQKRPEELLVCAVPQSKEWLIDA
jgi:hypothetical protein